ncbi:hypothetical protein B0H11DRAFT_235280 [Mycena galericulata]|nr:hypothetical protein B0H11DRAFT_235280 [Mycena galericulata]
MVLLTRRLCPENENPLAELRILDHLHADYSLLMDAIRRLHNACAKYCHRCHRIQRAPPPPDDPHLESDALAALTQFTARCREVRTCIDDALARWDDTAPAQHADLAHRARTAWLPWPLSSAPARRGTLLADLPSLQTNAAHNLRQLGDAYDALDRTVSQIEPTSTSVDAASLKTAIYALIALDIAFLDYEYGFRQVDQRLQYGSSAPRVIDRVPILTVAEEKEVFTKKLSNT